MEIKSIRFIHLENAGDIKAVFSFNLKGFIHNDFKIVSGPNGLYVSPPAKKNNRGEFKDLFYAESREINDIFQKLILQAYESDLEFKSFSES